LIRLAELIYGSGEIKDPLDVRMVEAQLEALRRDPGNAEAAERLARLIQSPFERMKTSNPMLANMVETAFSDAAQELLRRGAQPTQATPVSQPSSLPSASPGGSVTPAPATEGVPDGTPG